MDYSKDMVIDVVARMTDRPALIEDVVRSAGGDYPGEWESSGAVRDASDEARSPDDFPMVGYPGLGEGFERLYQIVEMKAYGVDAIFEEILAS